jgi:hypothetical protein
VASGVSDACLWSRGADAGGPRRLPYSHVVEGQGGGSQQV